jgi:nitroreductase
MMVAAWSFGVASGLYAGIKAEEMRRDFNLPSNLNVSAVVAFGYPVKKLLGKKDRKPLGEIAFLEKYGQKLNL